MRAAGEVRLVAVALVTSAIGAACAGKTPGAQPHDMSAAAHEQAAGEHTRTAEVHAGKYDPKAGTERTWCTPGGARPGPNSTAIEAIGTCWSSVQNPTETHQLEAQAHKRQAADHRAASAALREAEARACVGIAEADRDMSPFEQREDIASVAPLVLSEADARAKTPAERLLGAVVTFRAVPGLTAEWLQRIINCHLARNAALGHVVPEMPDCPLVPRGVQARVSPAGDGLAVEIRADHPAIAREVLARAQRLAPKTWRVSSSSQSQSGNGFAVDITSDNGFNVTAVVTCAEPFTGQAFPKAAQ